MVKETRFRHHPTRIEEALWLGMQELDLTGFYLDLQTAALVDLTGQDDTVFFEELTLSDLVTVPDDAIAVVLEVEANDSGSAGQACYIGFAPTGDLRPGKIQYVYTGNVADRKGSRIIIVLISTDESILYQIVASGAAFDYTIKLIGWLIGGTDLARQTPPAEELLCNFRI